MTGLKSPKVAKTAQPTCTIALVDADRARQAALQPVLSAVQNYKTVAACSTSREALDVLRSMAPDVAIIDLGLPALGAAEILKVAQQEKLATKLVFRADDKLLAVLCGAHAVVPRSASAKALQRTIDTLLAGKAPTSCMCAKPSSSNEGRHLEPMTKREHQIALLVADGLSNRRIADELGITEGTVKVHLHNVYLKIGVSSRARLAAAIERQFR